MEETIGKAVTFPKGSFIFKKNDFTRDLYIINTGKVRVFRQEGMRTITLSEYGKGSVIGEIASIDGGPRSATVEALEDTEVFVISPQEYKQKTASIPDWFMKIAKILVQRLRDTDKKIEHDISSSSEYNVALLLYYFTVNEGKEEPEKAKSVDLKKIQDELMSILRVPINTLTEILDSLEAQSFIQTKQDRLIIKNPEELEKHAKKLEKDMGKEQFG